MRRAVASIGIIAAACIAIRTYSQDGDQRRQLAHQHLALIEQAYAERQGAQAEMWRTRVKSNEEDLEHSLDWLIQNDQGEDALRFADLMNFYWSAFGELPKARQRLTQVLRLASASAPTLLRAKVLYDAGVLAFRQGDEGASRALNQESLAIGRRLNDNATIASALIGLSRLALRHHDYASVRRDAGEALRLRRQLADRSGELSAVHMLAAAARMQGDSISASKFYELTLGVSGENGDKPGVAGELMNLGYVNLHQHDADWAFRLFNESVSIYRELQSQEGLAWNIGGFAAVAAERRDGARAARLYGALDSAMMKLGMILDPDDQLDLDTYSKMASEQIGERQFETERTAGRGLSVNEALALAQQ